MTAAKASICEEDYFYIKMLYSEKDENGYNYDHGRFFYTLGEPDTLYQCISENDRILVATDMNEFFRGKIDTFAFKKVFIDMLQRRNLEIKGEDLKAHYDLITGVFRDTPYFKVSSVGYLGIIKLSPGPSYLGKPTIMF